MVGAIGIAFIADIFDLNNAIQVVRWISKGSGIFIFVYARNQKRVYWYDQEIDYIYM